MTTWFNFGLGVLLVFTIGLFRLGLTELDVAICIVASNISGLVSLLLYSAGGRRPWIRKHLLAGPFRTWVLFLIAYLGMLLGLAPALRDAVTFKWLLVPVILTTGVAIVIFGPLQDKLYARFQRRSLN